MESSRISVDTLAWIAALDYCLAPDVEAVPDDFSSGDGPEAGPDYIDVAAYPHTILHSVRTAKDYCRQDIKDTTADAEVSEQAIRFVEALSKTGLLDPGGYEQIRRSRQNTAESLNRRVH